MQGRRAGPTLRQELVALAKQGAMEMTALCRSFGISRKTGYKWLARAAHAGALGLGDRSRRPRTSPTQTAVAMEACVVELRRVRPAWGGRKIRHRLQDLGQTGVPAASPLTAILHRPGWVSPQASAQHPAFKRFEHASPLRFGRGISKAISPPARGAVIR